MPLNVSVISSESHPIIDGKSSKQRNSFDCGVFCLANFEKYIMGNDFPRVTQSLMRTFRCRYLHELYSLGMDIEMNMR